MFNEAAASLAPNPRAPRPTSAPRSEFNKAATSLAPKKAAVPDVNAALARALGSLGPAMRRAAPAVVGLPNLLAAIGLSQAREAMAASSGGVLPAEKTEKTAGGAPAKAPPLESRPKGSAELYDAMVAQLLGGKGSPISFRQLGALSGAIPGAPKPISQKDVIMAEVFKQAEQMRDYEVAQAEQNDDPQAKMDAVQRFYERTRGLVADPIDMSSFNAGE